MLFYRFTAKKLPQIILDRYHLEYSNVVWSPWYKKDVKIIDNVQKRASKAVAGLNNLDMRSA